MSNENTPIAKLTTNL